MSSAPVDAAARARALDPQESFIVQAPAGSGKTELLTQRYLRLLATVEAPEQILAITFTRKAAAEMRQRILQALVAAEGPEPDSPHKRLTWELACAVREADRKYGWNIERQPSRLRIQTIDAFSASLARRLPVIAGTGASVEPTDDPQPLYEAACLQLISRLGDGSEASRQLEALIVHLGNRVDRLVDLLIALLAKRDQWLHQVMHARGTRGLRATLEGHLVSVVERHLAELSAALGVGRVAELFELAQFAAENLLATDGISAERRAELEACLNTPAPLGAKVQCLAAWRSITALAFNKEGEVFSRVDKRHGFPTTNASMKQRLMQMLGELRTEEELCERLLELRVLPEPRYSDEQWRILEALLGVLPVAVVELQAIFQERMQADYVEIALRALRALGPEDEPTDLALAFDHRLQHLLVDEFQDTSFAQLDLLRRLTAGWQPGDGRTLFCVGDPMQSIYRFRQAEVGLFIELQQRGLSDNVPLVPLRLEANFRSEPAVVGWVNDVFPHVLAKRSDAEQGAVEYSPSVATRRREGSINVHPLIDADRAIEACVVAEIVRGTLEMDRDSTIAILVSTRTRVDAIARELTRSGINFQAVEIERLYERPIVQDLIALTRALVHLADRTAWLSVLRAPWCGLQLPDLHAIATYDAPTIDEALQVVQQGAVLGLSAEGRARALRTYAVLAAALIERGRWPLRTWIERAWNALAGPATAIRAQDLEDAEAFFERLEAFDEAGDLEDVTRLEERLENLFAKPRVLETSNVELMTIHAAKGLEFDTVILPGLDQGTRNEDRELLRWARIAGRQDEFVLAPIKADGSDSDPIYRWIEALESRRVQFERGRLLYVAATRAKKHLHLIGNVKTKERNGAKIIAEPREGSMLKMLWRSVSAQFEAVAPEAESPSTTRPAAPPQQLRRLPLDWTPPPMPEPLVARVLDVVNDDAERPPFDWVTQTSRHVGTLVHRELDRTLRGGAIPTENDRQRLEFELAELGVPPDRCADAASRVIDAIVRMHDEPRGRWLLGLTHEISEVESELALTGIVQGKMVQGVVDRTFVDADGVRWIVDFKTSTHEGGGLEDFLDEEVARYRPQLHRYSRLIKQWKPGTPLRMALYFPLLGAWREVDVGAEG
jgi:ATP-dependent helicase/nuclease subunit A